MLLVGVGIVEHGVGVVGGLELVHRAVVAHTDAAIINDITSVSRIVVFQVSRCGWWRVEAHASSAGCHALHKVGVEDVANHCTA